MVEIFNYLDSSCPQLDTSLLSVREEHKFIIKTTPPPRPATPTPEISYQVAPPYPDPYNEEDASGNDELLVEEEEGMGFYTRFSMYHDSGFYSTMKLKERIELMLKKNNNSCRVSN